MLSGQNLQELLAFYLLCLLVPIGDISIFISQLSVQKQLGPDGIKKKQTLEDRIGNDALVLRSRGKKPQALLVDHKLRPLGPALLQFAIAV